MRKFLQKIALTVPLYFSVLIAMELVGQLDPRLHYHTIGMTTHWGSVNERMQEWKSAKITHDNIDILFFGSSTCYEAIDPNELLRYDLEGFSFCSFSQTIGTSYHLASAAVQECPNLKTIALDLYPAAWQQKAVSVESTTDWIINTPALDFKWVKSFAKAALETESIHTVALSMTLPILKHLNIYNHNAPKDELGIYSSKGFVYRTMPALDAKPSCTETEVAFSPEHDRYLSRLKNLCEARNIKLVIINPPQLCPEKWNTPTSWNNLPSIDGMKWPESDNFKFYRDDHHLIGEGALNYSEWLAGKLSELH